MDRLFSDVKFALRGLMKSRGFTFAAVLALALGIGASTAIFSILDAVWVRPYQFAPGDRLQMLWESVPKQGLETNETAVMVLDDVRKRSGVFQELAGYNSGDINISGDGPPERLISVRAQAGFFDALEVKARLGRTFGTGEDLPNAAPVTVLSDRLFQRRFGGDPEVLGRTVTLDGRPYTVIGVLPKGFSFPNACDLFIPLVPTQEEASGRGFKWLRALGRLKPGVTLEQAKQQLASVAQQLQQEDPGQMAQRGFALTSVRDAYAGQMRPVFIALIGAVALLLLIACANVANLLLARATVRARELAVRSALGASRGQLTTQLLVESLVLAIVGAGLGVLFAMWFTDLLTAFAPGLAERISRGNEIRIDLRVLGFTLGLSVLSAVLFGLVPALQATRLDLHSTLKESGRGVSGRGRLRHALVVTELALALVLLVGSGLLLQSLYRMQASPPGFEVEGAMTFRVSLPEQRYPDAASKARFLDDLLPRLRAIPGVEHAAEASILPMSGSNQSSSVQVVGQPDPAPGEERYSNIRAVSPGYFEAMGIPLRAGRDLAPTDREGATPVAVVNEAFVRTFFPEGKAIGERFSRGGDPVEIVGVVGDVRSLGRGSKIQAPQPEAYYPYAQLSLPFTSFVLRTDQGAQVMPAVKRELAQVDGQQPIFAVRSLEELVGEALGSQRLSAGLLAVFAGIALLLAGVGVYAVMAYSVDQRRREIGVRMALGATHAGILRWLLAHGVRLTAFGLAIGCTLAFLASRALSGLLYEVTPTDPGTYAALAALLAAIALLATWIPARRASHVDPAITLKAE